MCATENENAAELSQQPLLVQNICLDFKLKAVSYRNLLVKFIEKNRSQLNLNGDEDITDKDDNEDKSNTCQS